MKESDKPPAGVEGIDYCEMCEKPTIELHNGNYVCQSCGVEQNVQDLISSEKRAYEKEEAEKRQSHAPFDPLYGHTDVGNYTDWNKLSGKAVYKAKKLAQIQGRQNSLQRREVVFTHYVKSQCNILGIAYEAVKDEISHLYKKGVKTDPKLFRGRSVENISVCYVKAAARAVLKQDINFVDIEKKTSLPHKSVYRVWKVLGRLNVLQAEHKPVQAAKAAMPYTAKYCSELGLPNEVEKEANLIYSRYIAYKKSHNIFSVETPRKIISGAIYIAAKDYSVPVTQTKLAKQVNITEVTIRKYVDILANRFPEYKLVLKKKARRTK